MDSVVEACKRVVTREEWGARPAKGSSDMATPVPFVILHHTDTPECFTSNDCSNRMRSMQNYHMDKRGWDDIAYSFVVGGDGLVYRGRGWDTVGSHARWYNFRSLGISIIGKFETKLPNKKAIEAVKEIINCAIVNNKLKSDYILYGHRQATPMTACPGHALFGMIQTWPHWQPGNHFPPKQ
nr:peptidoglycan-recognition protein 2-like [Lytechinus pictus]